MSYALTHLDKSGRRRVVLSWYGLPIEWTRPGDAYAFGKQLFDAPIVVPYAAGMLLMIRFDLEREAEALNALPTLREAWSPYLLFRAGIVAHNTGKARNSCPVKKAKARTAFERGWDKARNASARR